ncbi:MAG TPA: translation initiation factor [Myxococcaceae bacterium]|nr:translation initiation factor [Myxococcaceae bacterium]
MSGDDERRPFNNPFAALAGKRESLPSRPAPEPKKPAEAKGPARAVVRMERQGRGGKEVTVVEQLGLPARAMEAWLKELKAKLGCGGVLEDDALVLQGDHRERLPAILEKKGVRRISVG